MPERDLELTSRPFAENIRFAQVEDSFLIDERFAIKLHKSKAQQVSVKFAVDNRTLLSASRTLYDFGLQTSDKLEMQTPAPLFDLTPQRRLVYVGDSYKVAYQNPLVLRIESAHPISIEGIPGKITLATIFSQRIIDKLRAKTIE